MSSRFTASICGGCAFGVLLAATSNTSAALVDGNVWNNTTNSGGDQPAGLTTVTGSSTPLASVDNPKEAFGQNTGPIEPGTFLFADGLTADNGNGILGDGGEKVDFLTWSTSSWVVVSGYRAYLGSESVTQNRGTQLIRMQVQSEVDDVFDDNAQTGSFGPPFVDRLFSIDQVSRDLRIDLTRNNATGPRIIELDAIVPDPMPSGVYLDSIIFNAQTNSGGDEAAGLGLNYAASSVVNGIDTVQDAFGNNDGAVEPSTFIFGDTGSVGDNDNNTLDVGLETIDFISWDTNMPVTLAGYQLDLFSDGPNNPMRGTELFAFYVDNVLTDLLDMNAASGAFTRIFENGPVRGSSFRVELTRSVSTHGPRISEINAVVVPEMGSIMLVALMTTGLAATAIGRRRLALQARS